MSVFCPALHDVKMASRDPGNWAFPVLYGRAHAVINFESKMICFVTWNSASGSCVDQDYFNFSPCLFPVKSEI